MAAPYRDEHGQLQEFAQHIGVAEELLRQYEQIPQRLGADLTQEGVEQLKADARVAWEGVWEHLGEARAIVQTAGRGVAGYDRARAAAADIWLGAFELNIGPWESTVGGKRRTITWRNASTEPARDAIAALRAAMPEVVVTAPPPTPHVDLRRHGWLIDGWPVIVIAAIAALVVWRCAV